MSMWNSFSDHGQDRLCWASIGSLDSLKRSADWSTNVRFNNGNDIFRTSRFITDFFAIRIDFLVRCNLSVYSEINGSEKWNIARSTKDPLHPYRYYGYPLYFFDQTYINQKYLGFPNLSLSSRATDSLSRRGWYFLRGQAWRADSCRIIHSRSIGSWRCIMPLRVKTVKIDCILLRLISKNRSPEHISSAVTLHTMAWNIFWLCHG